MFAFHVMNNGKTQEWWVDLKKDGSVGVGEMKADMTVIISDKDFLDLASGKLNPQKVFCV